MIADGQNLSNDPGERWQKRHWCVEEQAVAGDDLAVFRSLDAVTRAPAEQVTLDRRSGVSRLSLAQAYYVKRFKGAGSRVKFCLGISRYQRELRNLQYFTRLGLATPRLVAHGYESRAGLLQRAVLVTAEVTGAIDLEQFLAAGKLYEHGLASARRLLAKLAQATRRLHAQGFYHKDLKTRNILVRQSRAQTELFFFDCPSGHHPPRVLLRRAIIRDLAHLVEGLQDHVRRVDLLYLYRQYRACKRLQPQDKALLREALAYPAKKRMTRKRRRREESKRQLRRNAG
jgi:hypothetical protein